jgi:rhodanese-related sulfurtransferase
MRRGSQTLKGCESNLHGDMKRGAIRQALILIALAFLPALGEAIYFGGKVPWQSRLSASEIVTVDQARSWGDNVTWVDARPSDEFESDHVPGAILLNEDSWNELLPQFLAQWSPDKTVVVYCSAQSCNAAAEVARRLRQEAGLSNVFVLQGGWEGWVQTR